MRLFRETLALARDSGEPISEQVIMLEKKISVAEGFCREIRQAISAGKGAIMTAKTVSNSLSNAKNWDIR